jgi:hypothetical protein
MQSAIGERRREGLGFRREDVAMRGWTTAGAAAAACPHNHGPAHACPVRAPHTRAPPQHAPQVSTCLSQVRTNYAEELFAVNRDRVQLQPFTVVGQKSQFALQC